MSQNIVNEITFLLHSFLMGIAITFVYDVFLILRRLIRHGLFLISLEDMVFWIACAVGVFYMLYEENNGILRWVAVFGATLGMIAYKKSVSSLIINTLSALIERIFHIFFKIIKFLLRPVGFLGRKAGRALKRSSRRSGKAAKCIKNKLTERVKLLKMILCKQ